MLFLTSKIFFIISIIILTSVSLTILAIPLCEIFYLLN